eukprot:178411-Rhodomonas_salina.2
MTHQRMALAWMQRREATSAVCLRVCYAISRTEMGHGAICLRARDAIPSTEIENGATMYL